ncbi:MAG: sarcosine oxidase subunit gamma family protein [Pseudomonadota bacterium]
MSEAAAVTRAGPQGMVSLRGLPEALSGPVRAVTGFDLPGQRSITGGFGGGAAWMSPDEFMLFCPHGAAALLVAELTASLGTTHHLALDVSDARAGFAIDGPACRDVLAKLAPVDLSQDAFGEGQIRRTRLAQVAAAFWMAGPELIQLVAFNSVAVYVEDLLRQAAQDGPLGFYSRT